MSPVTPSITESRVSKPAAAAVSIASNATLIALKLAAAAITGSVAILSEALHSMIDLIASVIAFISVRRADEPADVEHPYGHEKLESLAGSIEGMLILAGAALIVYESVHRLVTAAGVQKLGVGIAVIGFSAVANFAVSAFLRRQARRHRSPALAGDAAHLGTDALTSLGVLVGLALVQITGANAIDSAVAIAVAVLIVFAGVRILRQSANDTFLQSPRGTVIDGLDTGIVTESGALQATCERLVLAPVPLLVDQHREAFLKAQLGRGRVLLLCFQRFHHAVKTHANELLHHGFD